MSLTDAPLVIALGGNAISPEDCEGNLEQQFERTRATAATLAGVLQSGAPALITHGNGPQVGNVLRRVELAAHEVYPLPLDICVADTQGGMGYMIAQCLNNEFRRRAISRTATALVTTVEVSADDPAFGNPTKPIGGTYGDEQAEQYRKNYGWKLVRSPRGWRRVVPSPVPIAVLEIELVRQLVHEGQVVIAGGGGGVPVVRAATGDWQGVEAVIDKDRTSAVLANGIGAATLVIATAIGCVQTGFGTRQARELRRLRAGEARRLLEAGEFPPGSMGPKIQAAIDFLGGDKTGTARAYICHLDEIAGAIAGRNGTCMLPD
jgi:carbamate kinase